MEAKDAFGYLTKSFRHVRLLGVLNEHWQTNSTVPVGQLLVSWLDKEEVGNLESFSFVNQQTLLAHMYMTIVWYTENQRRSLFSDVLGDRLVSEVATFNAQFCEVPECRRPEWPELEPTIAEWGATIKKDRESVPEARTIAAYVIHLRNSVAHGQVEMTSDNSFMFRDRYPGTQRWHTELKLTFEQAARVTDALYLTLELDVFPLTPA